MRILIIVDPAWGFENGGNYINELHRPQDNLVFPHWNLTKAYNESISTWASTNYNKFIENYHHEMEKKIVIAATWLRSNLICRLLIIDNMIRNRRSENDIKMME